MKTAVLVRDANRVKTNDDVINERSCDFGKKSQFP